MNWLYLIIGLLIGDWVFMSYAQTSVLYRLFS